MYRISAYRGILSMNIQNKLIVLICSILILCLVVLIIQRHLEKNKLIVLFQEEKEEKSKVFDKILYLKGESLYNLTYDYTYWDEMVLFLKNKDKTWGKNNIETVLPTYHASYVWIYSADFSPIYSVSELRKTELKKLPLPEKALKYLFMGKNRFTHFFVNTPDGLIEIRGATIHPTADKERISEPEGYFFAGRLWDSKYLNELSLLTRSEIIMNTYSQKNRIDDKIEDDGVHFFKTLYGWNKEPIITMDIVSKTSIINSLNNASNWSLLIVITYALILLILLYTSITLWIRSPLRSITMALNKNNPDYLERLKHDRSEFGHISTLINQFFAQRSELIKEIEERKYLNEKLEKEITERKQVETLLRESEKRYRHLLEIAQEGIWAIDGEWNTTFINPKISDILGYTTEEMIDRKFLDFIDKDDRDYFRANMEKYKKTIREDLSCEFLKKDGKKIYTSLSLSPINDDKGNYTGNLALVTDITARKLAEEEKSKLEHQLRHSDKIRAIGTMAAGIAHDFNNILVAILGYTEAMIYNAPEGTIFEKNLKEIRNACNRAINLVKQILTFSRKSEVKRIPVQISPIVKETIKLLRRLLPSTIELKENIEENLVWIKADPTQIQQIIINLCTNSAQAMSEASGSMEIILKNLYIQAKDITIYENMKPGSYLQVTVTDTGHGIPPEIKERIFEPYFTTKKTGEGSGMGLAVVYGIVKAYGGDITVESNTGKGTNITIFFPSVEIDDKIPEKEDDVVLPCGKGKILFVDDEEISIVKIMKELLEQMGYQISSSNSSIEALQLFREKPDEYAIVITDEIMPKMKGSELAEEILRIRPDIPVILITGYCDPDLIEKAKATGVKEVLIKPVTLGKLTKTIRELLSDKKVNNE